jgi:hypothetical protein
MKAVRFLLLTISWSALVPALAYAAISNATSPEASPKTAARTPGTLLPKRRPQSAPATSFNPHPTSHSGPAAVKAKTLPRAATVDNSLATRTTAVPRQSLNNVRHRGVNPAVITGTPASLTRKTGAIDGARMHRRP